tara:strand:- start:563 stop:781 length:219 start_codon:yes stop_codon:yes gene_type:complete
MSTYQQFLADYFDTVESPQFRRSDLRRGQLWFNMLTVCNSPLAEVMRSDAALDPFYRDEVLPASWAYAKENW